MTTVKHLFHVNGMTCSNCEKTISRALRKIDGVAASSVSFPKKSVEVIFYENKVTVKDISDAIENAGYIVKSDDEYNKSHPISQVLPFFLIIVSLYFIIKVTFGFDVFNLIPKIDTSISLFALFITGLLTSVHCIAMCGGINVSQCASGDPDKSDHMHKIAIRRVSDKKPVIIDRFTRPLMYNMGRVLSYTIIGGLVGGLGSVLFVSLTMRGIIMIIAAMFMILMGLSMLGWLPYWLVPRMPAKWSAASAKAKVGRGPFTVGILNGLIPCGPLQAMQLYALSTGSVLTGALSMFIFAMGTVPLMLGAGMIISMLKKKHSHVITRASAVFVILIAVVMVGNAFNFFGWNISSTVSAIGSPSTTTIPNTAAFSNNAQNPNLPANKKYSTAKIENGVQTVEAAVSSGGYPSIVVQAGIPVKFNLKAANGDLNGCNGSIIIPKFNLQQKLNTGDNIISFTPPAIGTINYTCWMGMISGRIYVVADLTNSNLTSSSDSNVINVSTTSSSGDSALNASSSSGTDISSVLPETNNSATLASCCSAGIAATAFANGKIPLDEIAVGVIDGDTQTVTVNVNDSGYSPALLVVQKGIKTKIKFNAEKLNSCNRIVSFPDYGGSLDLSSSNGLSTPEIILTNDITFSCGMGMLHGYVKVVDDINNYDAVAIKNEVANYTFSGSGGCCGQ